MVMSWSTVRDALLSLVRRAISTPQTLRPLVAAAPAGPATHQVPGGDPELEASLVPIPETIPEPADDIVPDPTAPALVPNPVLSAFEAAYEREVLVNLVQACERLFHAEWSLTLHNVRDNYPTLFGPSSTFLEPGVQDEYEQWESRGEFLDAWRDAEALVHSDSAPAAAEDAGEGDHRADYDVLNALVASGPQAKCLPPSATPGSYNWLASHTWQHAGAGLQCQDCGERWPQPKGEAEL